MKKLTNAMMVFIAYTILYILLELIFEDELARFISGLCLTLFALIYFLMPYFKIIIYYLKNNRLPDKKLIRRTRKKNLSKHDNLIFIVFYTLIYAALGVFIVFCGYSIMVILPKEHIEEVLLSVSVVSAGGAITLLCMYYLHLVMKYLKRII